MKKLITAILMPLLLGLGTASADGLIKHGSFFDGQTLEIEFAKPVRDILPQLTNDSWRIVEASSPDITLAVARIESVPTQPTTLRLVMANSIDRSQAHDVFLESAAGEGSTQVSRSFIAILVAILLSALLINNYVFSRYLGLCVFYGTTQSRDTAIGTGITFTIVMVTSSVLACVVYQLILKPLSLGFLQILIFIGMTACLVHAMDTILRKVNPVLFKKLGIYLMLITVNCIILAVPLTLADNDYNLLESIMLGIGAGGGFALALYLMACARERLTVAKVPESFRGLPIAFIITGLFALAFMGFSGLTIF